LPTRELNSFEKTVQILNQSDSFIYHKDLIFNGNINDTKSRLIFNNIQKIDNISYDPVFGGHGISEGDINYEEFLFDTLKLSNEELQQGINAVIDKIENSESFQGLTLVENAKDFKDYFVSIKQIPKFSDSFFQLNTIIMASTPTDEYDYVTEIQVINKIAKISLNRQFTLMGGLGDPGKVFLPLPALKNNKIINTYYVTNMISIGGHVMNSDFIRKIEYFIINKNSNEKKLIQRDGFSYKEYSARLNEHERLMDKLAGDLPGSNDLFFSKSEYRILLEYLAILFTQLQRNIRISN